MELPDGIELKPSPIHGLGIFAKRNFRKGEKIGEYVGERYTLREFKEKYGKDIQYCYVARRANYVICAKENRNWLTYCNESLNPNLKLKERFAYATRLVSAGEELFLQYAKDYSRDYSLN